MKGEEVGRAGLGVLTEWVVRSMEGAIRAPKA